jgi:hypothetical protein
MNPIFHSYDSHAHYESLAIIFYPMIIFTAININYTKKINEWKIIFLSYILLLILSITHHFTSYMVVFSLLIPTLIFYIKEKIFISKIRFLILSTILPLFWLSYIALPALQSHSKWFIEIVNKLIFIHGFVGYVSSPAGSSSTYYPSNFSIYLTIIRTLILFMLTVIGFLWPISREKIGIKYFRALLITFSGVTFILLYLVNWSQIAVDDIRDRIVTFTYIPISLFSAVGIEKVRKKIIGLNHYRSLVNKIFILVFIIIFLPPTIFNAFSREIYDPNYSPVLSVEYSVAPLQQYFLGNWVHQFINSKTGSFSGSISSNRYVIGYGFYKGLWLNDVFYLNTSSYNDELYYVINMENIKLPDSSNRLITSDVLNLLEKKFEKIYDNGIIKLYKSKL